MIQTASGMQYEDLVEGTGKSPIEHQTCLVHFTCWTLRDGAIYQKYESSHDDGQPVEFRLGWRNRSAAWNEGIATMKPGGKRRVLLPPYLFEFELLQVSELSWSELAELPGPLAIQLETMCRDSLIQFPQGGMWPAMVAYDVAIPAQPTRASESNDRLCEWFRCCVQGDTTRSVPEAAQELVDQLLAAIHASFPGCSVHVEIEESRGWLDSLNLWVTTPDKRLYIDLEWTVS